MASKHPHQMPLTEYVEWARSKIVAPDGRISRAGVAEVRRDLVSRVGYLRRTDDERTMQEFIKRLDPNVDLTTESLAELKHATATDILASAVRHPIKQVRYGAAIVLAARHDARALPALIKGLREYVARRG